MSRTIEAAGSFTHWWVRLYTAGLDGVARNERREEVASDVWEQGHDRPGRSTGVAMLGRCLAGIPADLSWRAEQARVGEAMVATVTGALAAVESAGSWMGRRGFPGLTVVVAVLAVVLGVALIATAQVNENQTIGSAIAGGILFVVAGSFMLAGQQVIVQQPRAGALMISLGVLPVGLVFFASVVIPAIALAVIIAAWRRAIVERRLHTT